MRYWKEESVHVPWREWWIFAFPRVIGYVEGNDGREIGFGNTRSIQGRLHQRFYGINGIGIRLLKVI